MADFVFRRREQKYLMSAEQAEAVKEAMARNMLPDRYFISAIRNIYYDTPDFRLIRRSIEKPEYKEKIRLRSYGDARDDSKVFLELKKKYRGIVYKRRLALRTADAVAYMADLDKSLGDTQIGREIDYFKRFYAELYPAVYLSYDRLSWRSHDGELRITMDTNIRYRTEDVDLRSPCYGTDLLEPGQALMEIKAPGAMPLWLASLLSEQKIRQTSYSKYGSAYQRLLAEHKLESRGFHYV